MNNYFIPQDCKETTEKYLIDRGGICGQSCLAVIEKNSIQEVLDNWKDMGIEFKGYSGWKQLREYLEKRGFLVKQKKAKGLCSEFKKDYYYILRVQWIGEEEHKEKPYYGWKSWYDASANTHFIVVHNGKYFCNEEGKWLLIFDEKYSLKGYLIFYKGLITSAFEITKHL